MKKHSLGSGRSKFQTQRKQRKNKQTTERQGFERSHTKRTEEQGMRAGWKPELPGERGNDMRGDGFAAADGVHALVGFGLEVDFFLRDA
jgi:hypothetical protein